MKVTIRNVTANDYSVLRSLAFQCEPLDRHTPYTYWVCCNYFSDWGFILEIDGNPVGYIMAISANDTIFIWQIAVLPQFQKQGYSHKLINAVIMKMKEKNYHIFQTTIAPSNESSNLAFKKFAEKNDIAIEQVGKIHISDEQEHILSDEIENIYKFTFKQFS